MMNKTSHQVDATIDYHLTMKDLLEVAMAMEHEGAEFYRMLAESYDGGRLRDFFLRLSGMEIKHELKLNEWLKSLGPERDAKITFDEGYTDREYFVHLKKLALKKAYPDGADLFAIMDSFEKPEDALEMAVTNEQNAVKLYQILSNFALTDNAAKIVQWLLVEEQAHVKEIKEILAQING